MFLWQVPSLRQLLRQTFAGFARSSRFDRRVECKQIRLFSDTLNQLNDVPDFIAALVQLRSLGIGGFHSIHNFSSK